MVAVAGTFALILFPNTHTLGIVLVDGFPGASPGKAEGHGLCRRVRCPGFGHQQVRISLFGHEASEASTAVVSGNQQNL